jgi:hypothetical protein
MKTIVVASKEAQFLRDLFPINEPNLGDVSKEEKLRSQTLPDQFFTRKSRSDKIHQSEADRKKAYRNHHRKTNVRDKPKGKDGYPSRSDSDGLGFSTATSPLLPSARASIFRKKKDWYHSAIFDGDLFGLFSDTHQRTLGSKEENHLICPAIFDPNQGDGSTKRGLQNIVSIGGFIGFDFENGHLGPDDLTGSVSDNPPWISNSFRHTKENQRFHAFFPLTREVTVEEFNFLWDQIIIRIEARGYSVGKDRKGFKRSGLDTSKRPACSLFYFPCQAADPEASFSIEVWNPIDPDDWLSNPIYPAEGSHVAPEAPRKPRESHPRPSNRPVNPVAVKEATDRWRATPIGQQNAAFYQLGWDYAKAWMPVWDIETTLRMEAEYANNKPERLRQIPAIIRDIEAWN